ncbi:hypothetical protein HOLleu_42571 [Holothuria leucospilota]|uniref:Uncharacterized protein n=1 Tax=Holothuria leucospilota TaxID=206669 RepID=A0A9Q0YAE9_HOLLE|nr:hypothetical protein HOLleu_42571 [Holothuria leucospilota]
MMPAMHKAESRLHVCCRFCLCQEIVAEAEKYPVAEEDGHSLQHGCSGEEENCGHGQHQFRRRYSPLGPGMMTMVATMMRQKKALLEEIAKPDSDRAKIATLQRKTFRLWKD